MEKINLFAHESFVTWIQHSALVKKESTDYLIQDKSKNENDKSRYTWIFSFEHFELIRKLLQAKIVCYILLKSGDIIQQFITLADTFPLSANWMAGERLCAQSGARTPTTILHPFIRKWEVLNFSGNQFC